VIARLVREVAAADTPLARLVHAPGPGLAEPVAVLAGAFDPPTRAHAAVAESALREHARAFLFALAVHTIDKEASASADIELRLRMLSAIVANRPRVGLVVCNRGLYVDQAEALRGLGIQKPLFTIGFDKVPQLFDARYYQDRDAALQRLFERARFLVVPRDDAGAEELERFMALPGQRSYADAVETLVLDPREEQEIRGVSSTRVRMLLARQGSWQPLVPREIWSLVQESGAYHRASTGSSVRPATTL
jgi:nicotinic acid mononucleotide adenylyltransferase